MAFYAEYAGLGRKQPIPLASVCLQCTSNVSLLRTPPAVQLLAAKDSYFFCGYHRGRSATLLRPNRGVSSAKRGIITLFRRMHLFDLREAGENSLAKPTRSHPPPGGLKTCYRTTKMDNA